MTLIPDLFRKLGIPENVVRYMSKKSCFKGPFDRQQGKRVKHCCYLGNSTVTIFNDHLEGN